MPSVPPHHPQTPPDPPGDGPSGPTPSAAAARAAATRIVHLLQSQGHVAYFAGGCVRDELLGLTPKDYDVATDATPQRLLSLFRNTREVGAHFGVVHVHENGVVVEVATFRTDGPYTDSRRPDSVTFSNATDDAHRRDFTINALFLNPVAASQHDRIIDLVGGLEDLKNRVLRAVGDPHKRLAEDHLRALRAVRLAARLGFTIDPATAAAIRKEASLLSGVSRERIGDELRRMLDHPRRAEAIAILRDLALDGPVLSEPCQPNHPVAILASLPHDAPVPLALAAWSIDRAEHTRIPELLRRWRTALCLSNDEAHALKYTLSSLDHLQHRWSDLTVAERKRLASRSYFDWSMLIFRSLQPSLHGEIDLQLAALRATASGIAPAPWVTGDDLVSLGLAPGPKFKALLDRLYDAQLEDRVSSREGALELARDLSV